MAPARTMSFFNLVEALPRARPEQGTPRLRRGRFSAADRAPGARAGGATPICLDFDSTPTTGGRRRRAVLQGLGELLEGFRQFTPDDSADRVMGRTETFIKVLDVLYARKD
ncbi:hypothetical protein GCM10020229_33930 [Kitasatospora albolonga]